MIVTIDGIPVYDALISDEECGMLCISLVDAPAVMSNFQAFDEAKQMQMYTIADAERRLVRGVIMRADFPIFRRDKRGEYYVIYKAEEIRKMAEKYLCEGRQNLVNLMHQGEAVEGVQMTQYFIKGDGISVDGFDECADGSLFGEFHIVNDEIWNAVKDGTYKGFSLEGIFELKPEQDIEKTEEIVDALDGAFSRIFKHTNTKTMSKLSKLKAALAKVLQEFGTITTDKGVLAWDGEEDLKAGDEVFIEDAEGNRTKAEDGDYTTEDNKVIVVVDGKVAEIKDAEAEVAPEAPEAEAEPTEEVEAEGEEETPAPEAEEEEDKDAIIKELEEKVAALEAENAALKEELEKMQKMSAAKPAHEEVETSVQFAKTGNRGLDNFARIISAK